MWEAEFDSVVVGSGAGGFELSQPLREQYLPGPTQARWSAASPDNTGDMLVAALSIAAAHLSEPGWTF